MKFRFKKFIRLAKLKTVVFDRNIRYFFEIFRDYVNFDVAYEYAKTIWTKITFDQFYDFCDFFSVQKLKKNR